MASQPGKDDKSESRRDRAVSRYLVPILVAWLLAVLGLVYWDVPTSVALERAGKLALYASVALAFLTVILAAVQDMVSVKLKQRLLFPGGETAFPSGWAFEPKLLAKAGVNDAELEGREGIGKLAELRNSWEAQNKAWIAGYLRNKDEVAVAQFSARHIAWRDAVPLLILLAFLTWPIGWRLGFPGGQGNWLTLGVASALLGVMCWFAGRRANVGLIIEVLKLMANEPRPVASASVEDRSSSGSIVGTQEPGEQQ